MLLSTDSVQLIQRIAHQRALEGLRSFNRVQLIRTVKYVEELMLMNREETLLHTVIVRRIEIGRCYGMKINLENAR